MSDLDSLAIAPLEAFPPELVDEPSTHAQPSRSISWPHPRVQAGLRTNLRVEIPTGAGEFEMMHWVLVERDPPEEYKAALRRKVLLQSARVL